MIQWFLGTPHFRTNLDPLLSSGWPKLWHPKNWWFTNMISWFSYGNKSGIYNVSDPINMMISSWTSSCLISHPWLPGRSTIPLSHLDVPWCTDRGQPPNFAIRDFGLEWWHVGGVMETAGCKARNNKKQWHNLLDLGWWNTSAQVGSNPTIQVLASSRLSCLRSAWKVVSSQYVINADSGPFGTHGTTPRPCWGCAHLSLMFGDVSSQIGWLLSILNGYNPQDHQQPSP